MAYADYAYYTTEWLGTAITELDFPRLSLRASDFIDYITRNKAAAATDASIITALSKACCAVAEQMQTDEKAREIAAQAADTSVESGRGEIRSETVGGYSVTYTTSTDYISENSPQEASKRYMAIVMRYLANTGLLYRGAC